MKKTSDICNWDDLNDAVSSVKFPRFLRAYQHTFKIEEEEKILECSEYIHKYIIMHGSGVLRERYVKRLCNPTHLWFEVTYIFSEFAKTEKIIEELEQLQLPDSEQVKRNEFIKELYDKNR